MEGFQRCAGRDNIPCDRDAQIGCRHPYLRVTDENIAGHENSIVVVLLSRNLRAVVAIAVGAVAVPMRMSMFPVMMMVPEMEMRGLSVIGSLSHDVLAMTMRHRQPLKGQCDRHQYGEKSSNHRKQRTFPASIVVVSAGIGKAHTG